MECFLFAFGSVSNQLYSLTGFQVLYGYGSEARYLLHLHKRCQYRCPQSVRFGLQSQICLTSLFHMLWLLLFYIVAIMPDIQLLTSCYNRFFIYFGLAVVLYIFFNSLLPQRARSITGVYFFTADLRGLFSNFSNSSNFFNSFNSNSTSHIRNHSRIRTSCHSRTCRICHTCRSRSSSRSGVCPCLCR